MTEDDRGRETAPGPEIEEPIFELAEYAEAASPGLVRGVRNSLLRRGLASDLAHYAWFAPLRILVEYLGLALTLLGGGGHKRGDGEE